MWSLDHGAESDPASTLDESLPHSHAVPWGAGKTEVPRSDAEGHDGAVANVDTAIDVAAGEGLKAPHDGRAPRRRGRRVLRHRLCLRRPVPGH